MMTAIRRGGFDDLAAIAAIQASSPEAAHWPPEDYLAYDLSVATVEGHIAGFLVVRFAAPDEGEILNLAIAPEFRRHGLARQLLAALCEHFRGWLFLEVRESNQGARSLYETFGFQEIRRIPNYYNFPRETAIVLKFHSC